MRQANPFTTTVKTTISRLRAKLGEPPRDRDGPRGRLPDLSARTAPSGSRLPAGCGCRERTARLRLTLLYSGLFLLLGHGPARHHLPASQAQRRSVDGSVQAVPTAERPGLASGPACAIVAVRAAATPVRPRQAARGLVGRAGADGARLGACSAGSPPGGCWPAAVDHDHGADDLRRQPAPAARARRTRRRVQAARRHARRPARAARGLVRGAAAVRRQRLARAADAADGRADAASGRARGPGRERREAPRDVRGSCSQPGREQERCSSRC